MDNLNMVHDTKPLSEARLFALEFQLSNLFIIIFENTSVATDV